MLLAVLREKVDADKIKLPSPPTSELSIAPPWTSAMFPQKVDVDTMARPRLSVLSALSMAPPSPMVLLLVNVEPVTLRVPVPPQSALSMAPPSSSTATLSENVEPRTVRVPVPLSPLSIAPARPATFPDEYGSRDCGACLLPRVSPLSMAPPFPLMALLP